MPIYEYRCGSCGYQSEFLQKISDDPIKVCPRCSSTEFAKMVTAAGFQLKGSGWYATDFKGSGSKPATAKSTSESSEASSEGAKSTASEKTSSSSGETKGGGGCGGSCACHN